MLTQLLSFLLNTSVHILVNMFFLRFIFTHKLLLHRSHIGRFCASCTDWLILPVRFLFPIWRGFDLACLVILYGLTFLQGLLLYCILLHDLPSALWGLAFISGVHATIVVLNLLSLFVFFQVLLTWVNPLSPMMLEMMAVTDSFLVPIQKRLPLFSGIDFSAAVFLISVELGKLILKGWMPFWWN